MKATPTPNEFIAEAQAKELSRQCGVAYLNYASGYYLATAGRGDTSIYKFENGKKIAL